MARTSTSRVRILATAAVAVALAACEAPTRLSDYEEQQPLTVVQKDVELVLDTAVEFEPLTLLETKALQAFVSDYQARAAGPITIQMHRRDAAHGDAETRIGEMRKLLSRAGISAGEINVLPLGTTAPRDAAIVLSFRANEAVLPECGHWSTSQTYNWSNRSQINHGCATQRNLGATIANPGDLNKAATLSNSDASRGERILNSYRSGATAGGAAGGTAAP